MNRPLVLALETSCDETAAAVLVFPGELRGHVVASQAAVHAAYGGVVPEVASRNHLAHVREVTESALKEARAELRDVDVFAATTGPGLASALLVGASAAKGFALALEKPFVAANHIEGHLLSPFFGRDEVPPSIGLVVSGGHTLLVDIESAGNYRLLGRTLDDAAGEAFDKVGKMLGLPYPGGPEIEKAAIGGNPAAYDFPRSMLHDPHLDFSFSGLKTAVLYTLQKEADAPNLSDLAASFQQAVIEILIAKTLCAARQSGRGKVALSGGVSLNRALREAMRQACADSGLELVAAAADFCTDNAAMIAFAALLRHLAGERSPLGEDIHPNLPLVNSRA